MPGRQAGAAVAVAVLSASLLFQTGCSVHAPSSQPETRPVGSRQPETRQGAGYRPPQATLVPPPQRAKATALPGHAPRGTAEPRGNRYPLHTRIVATTFWVGEIFDPNASDGSQVISTYDSHWMQHYGGCDGVVMNGNCQTEPRTAGNGFFPTRMTPGENPFYLDLPFDDLNDPAAFSQRARVIPWAKDSGYSGRADDSAFSYMKNRWVKLMRDGRTCYGQIEDAGPGEYDDYPYVFGADDRRPANTRYNGAGLDVSPALNGCLAFSELNGENDLVDWQFVDGADVPPGPWTRLVTTRGVSE